MKFRLENQTLKDLNIFSSRRDDISLFSIFDKSISAGGKKHMMNFFLHPLDDIQRLEKRRDMIRYLYKKKISLELDNNMLNLIEHYLNLGNKPVRKPSEFQVLEKELKQWLRPANEHFIIRRAVGYIIEILIKIHRFAKIHDVSGVSEEFHEYLQRLKSEIESQDFLWILSLKSEMKLSPWLVARCDFLFRYIGFERLRSILDMIYDLDALTAAASVAEDYNFSFPDFINGNENLTLELHGGFHPLLTHPVKNDLTIKDKVNTCFITGANMSGKSTFIKTIGMIIHLAHLGFPVPASRFRTKVFNGLETQINIPDDIQKGYSHFYNEVLRLKKGLDFVNSGNNLVLIMDEPFRGTNMKDAKEATVAVLDLLKHKPGSLFFFSTHITEAIQDVENSTHLIYRCFPMILQGDQPEFCYEIKEGVANDRSGLFILKELGLLSN